MPLQTTLLVLGLTMGTLFLVAGLTAWVRGLRRRAKAQGAERQMLDAPCCAWCGYNLTGMEIPRCPECGRARGFDKTFDELGISEQQVIEYQRRRRQELAEHER